MYTLDDLVYLHWEDAILNGVNLYFTPNLLGAQDTHLEMPFYIGGDLIVWGVHSITNEGTMSIDQWERRDQVQFYCNVPLTTAITLKVKTPTLYTDQVFDEDLVMGDYLIDQLPWIWGDNFFYTVGLSEAIKVLGLTTNKLLTA